MEQLKYLLYLTEFFACALLKISSLKDKRYFLEVPDIEGLFRFVSMRDKFTEKAGDVHARIPEPFLSQRAQTQVPHPLHAEPLLG